MIQSTAWGKSQRWSSWPLAIQLADGRAWDKTQTLVSQRPGPLHLTMLCHQLSYIHISNNAFLKVFRKTAPKSPSNVTRLSITSSPVRQSVFTLSLKVWRSLSSNSPEGKQGWHFSTIGWSVTLFSLSLFFNTHLSSALAPHSSAEMEERGSVYWLLFFHCEWASSVCSVPEWYLLLNFYL